MTRFAQHSEHTKCFLFTNNQFSEYFLLHLFTCVYCACVYMYDLAGRGQMAISAATSFLPMELPCTKSQGIRPAWYKCLHLLSHLLGFNFKFYEVLKATFFSKEVSSFVCVICFQQTKLYWCENECPIFGQRCWRVWRWSRDPGWAAVQKSLILWAQSSCQQRDGPFP